MEERKSFWQDPVVQKKRWLILFAIGLFTFMATLDGSIVNIALPVISEELNVPMNQSTWIVSIYLMVICACLPLFGKIGDSYGKIKVFQWGTLIFVIGSFLCGIPHSLISLLVGRAVQAFGASMTMATNIGIITEVFPFSERGRALGLIGSFVSLGSITGPGIGGIIVAHFGWSYIFWINIPVGIFTMLLGKFVLPKDLIKSKDPIDWNGFITFAIAILTLFFGVFLGQEIGFTTLLVLGLWGIAIISFIVFYQLEQWHKYPMIEFSIFHNKLLTVSLITALLIFAANFFMNVVLPFFLENAHGYSSAFSGMLMMVFPIVMVITAPISGYLTDKLGAEKLTVIGLIILTITQGAFIILNLATPLVIFIIMLALLGLGNGIFQSPNNTLVMSSVEKTQLGQAGSLNALARNIGMVVGIALSTTILYHSMSAEVGYTVKGYIEGQPEVYISGMHVVYIGSFLLCLIATILTAYRFIAGKKVANQGVHHMSN